MAHRAAKAVNDADGAVGAGGADWAAEGAADGADGSAGTPGKAWAVMRRPCAEFAMSCFNSLIPFLNHPCRLLHLLAVLKHCLRRCAYFTNDLEMD